MTPDLQYRQLDLHKIQRHCSNVEFGKRICAVMIFRGNTATSCAGMQLFRNVQPFMDMPGIKEKRPIQRIPNDRFPMNPYGIQDFCVRFTTLLFTGVHVARSGSFPPPPNLHGDDSIREQAGSCRSHGHLMDL